ncbi:hypothetical protein LguiA_033389 [Lonicera macranthoides]
MSRYARRNGKVPSKPITLASCRKRCMRGGAQLELLHCSSVPQCHVPESLLKNSSRSKEARKVLARSFGLAILEIYGKRFSPESIFEINVALEK